MSRVLLLAGEPGIGKTRLSQRASDFATDKKNAVHWARCYEQEGIPPYWPWVKLIRSFLDAGDPDSVIRLMGNGVTDIGRVVDDVQQLIEGADSEDQIDPQQRRFRFFDAMTRFFQAVSRQSPLLLIIDNLHCADIGSLQLLEFFRQETETNRITVLGTYRSTEVDSEHPLNVTLGELARHGGYEHLSLSGLFSGEVAKLLNERMDNLLILHGTRVTLYS